MDIAPAILLAIYIARRFRASWRYWFYGVLIFLIFQAITRIPLITFIQRQPFVQTGLQQLGFFWLFLLFLSLTAGLFEEGGRWLAFRFVIPGRDRKWSTALMVGAGHGGLEAIGVGILQLIALVSYLAINFLPAGMLTAYSGNIAQMQAQYGQLQGWEPLLGGWERICAVAIQIGLTVMVLQSFTSGRRWWWYALAFHTLVDFTSVGVLYLWNTNVGHIPALIATEALVTVYALIMILYILRTGRGGLLCPPGI